LWSHLRRRETRSGQKATDRPHPQLYWCEAGFGVANHDGKTEKATPRRRQEARREGQIAQSKEVAVAASLLAGLMSLQAIGPGAARTFREQTTMLLGSAGQHTELPTGVLLQSVTSMVSVLPLFMGVLLFAGIAAALAQVGFVFATKAARPKMKNLSLKRGLERFKPAPAMWELTRSTLKLGLLSVLLIAPVADWMDAMKRRKNLAGALEEAHAELTAILWRVVVLAVLIAVADYAWNKWRTSKQQRMSKQEVKREHREQDGDPYQKAARRSRALSYSRNRMLHDVALADVVVTNPTHFAVALRYEPHSPAPRVVAKGMDRMAAKIRREAYRQGVLVTENKPLARELYRRCKPGQLIPAHLFEAVALVLALAYRRRPKLWQAMNSTPPVTAKTPAVATAGAAR